MPAPNNRHDSRSENNWGNIIIHRLSKCMCRNRWDAIKYSLGEVGNRVTLPLRRAIYEVVVGRSPTLFSSIALHLSFSESNLIVFLKEQSSNSSFIYL